MSPSRSATEVAERHHAGSGRRRPDDHRHADGKYGHRGLPQGRQEAAELLISAIGSVDTDAPPLRPFDSAERGRSRRGRSVPPATVPARDSRRSSGCRQSAGSAIRKPAARSDERVVVSGTLKFSGFSIGSTSSWAISEMSRADLPVPAWLIALTAPSASTVLEQRTAVGASGCCRKRCMLR